MGSGDEPLRRGLLDEGSGDEASGLAEAFYSPSSSHPSSLASLSLPLLPFSNTSTLLFIMSYNGTTYVLHLTFDSKEARPARR
jgi:hypothetical protein